MEPLPEIDPRVALASERTLLAWVRTALALMGFGFVVARFGLFLRELAAMGPGAPGGPGADGSDLSPSVNVSNGTHGSLWIGVSMILIGAVITLLAANQHMRFIRRLQRNEPYQPKSISLGVLVALGLTIVGGLMAGYLLIVSTS